MDFRSLLTDDDRAGLDRWFHESGDLLVEVFHPHSGAGSRWYVFSAVSQLDQCLEAEVGLEIGINVYRDRPFPYRGVAAAELVADAMKGLPDGEHYAVASFEDGLPGPCYIVDETDKKDELLRIVGEVTGQQIGIGLNPCGGQRGTPKWISSNAGRVFHVEVRRNRNNWQYSP
jgi:hypothetical protein